MTTKVYVVDVKGDQLFPTTQGKARRLLKHNKAMIERRNPFTIRLLKAVETRNNQAKEDKKI